MHDYVDMQNRFGVLSIHKRKLDSPRARTRASCSFANDCLECARLSCCAPSEALCKDAKKISDCRSFQSTSNVASQALTDAVSPIISIQAGSIHTAFFVLVMGLACSSNHPFQCGSAALDMELAICGRNAAGRNSASWGAQSVHCHGPFCHEPGSSGRQDAHRAWCSPDKLSIWVAICLTCRQMPQRMHHSL